MAGRTMNIKHELYKGAYQFHQINSETAHVTVTVNLCDSVIRLTEEHVHSVDLKIARVTATVDVCVSIVHVIVEYVVELPQKASLFPPLRQFR